MTLVVGLDFQDLQYQESKLFCHGQGRLHLYPQESQWRDVLGIVEVVQPSDVSTICYICFVHRDVCLAIFLDSSLAPSLAVFNNKL